tara:strand:- start:1043 stop:4243 length:3201 start_codon:yes stop_codon:yes gene_type:complete
MFYTLCWSVLLCFGLFVTVMQDRSLPVPESVQVRIHTALNAANFANITFDHAEIGLTELFHLKLILTGAQFMDAESGTGARFGILDVVLDGAALFVGKIAPKSVRLSDAVFDVTRKQNGSFDLGFSLSSGSHAIQSLNDVLTATEAFFERQELASLKLGQLDQLTVNYVDRVNNRSWTFDGGRVNVQRVAGGLQLRGDLALLTGGSELATLGFFYSGTELGSGTLGAEFNNISAQDLALQSQALTWLNFVDGNLSGSFRSTRILGELGALNAILDFGQGTLNAGSGSMPVSYSEAKTYFSYMPSLGRLEIDLASVKSDWGSLSAEGYALLLPDTGNSGYANGMVLHLDVENAILLKTPWLQDPVTISNASTQMKINYSPLKIDVGQLHAQVNGAQMSLSGKANMEPLGWSYEMRGKAPDLQAQTILKLWPKILKPKSYRWFKENVKKGSMKNLTLHARKSAGSIVDLASSFQFDQADVRFMRFMPMVLDGVGYGTFQKDQLVLTLQSGYVKASEGGNIAFDGSVMRVPNTRVPEPPATFTLRGHGPIHATMSLLDNKPFQISTKSKRDVDDVTGQITFEAQVSTWLKKGVQPKDVNFDVSGILQNVRSEVLVPGRILSAKTMALSVDPTRLEVTGAGSLSGVPFTGSWIQPLGVPGLSSQVVAMVELSAESLVALNIALPNNSISGKAVSTLTLDIAKDTPVGFKLFSNLEGASLQVPALKWKKSQLDSGKLKVTGFFSKPMIVNSLEFKAAGLSTEGRIEFDAEGIDRVLLSDFQVSNWLSSEVTLVNRGSGVPMEILVSDGILDLRKFPQTKSLIVPPTGSAAPLKLKLQSLQISDSLTLTDVAAEFADGLIAGGLFSGKVNGGTPISGKMVGSGDRLRLDLVSQDAGGALRDAGLLRQANGGVMDLLMTPYQGGWNGDLKIRNVRIKDAPQVAQLLSAASIVGLLDQVEGKGIFFNNIDSKFSLKNELLTIYESSAVGPSLGMSMDGYINTKSKKLDLQGVLSPFYLVNGIGAFLTRRGEGLIGFNFTLRGATEAPEAAVNPLSLFTPGMFREIFRRKAPEQN